MNKKNNNKGFTLAELLIVVAIIAVLVAIAIPVFTSQLEKSREATDMANLRSAYAQVVADNLSNGKAVHVDVELKQRQEDWQSTDGQVAGIAVSNIMATKDDGTADGMVGQGKKVRVTIDATGQNAKIGTADVPDNVVTPGS